MISSQSDSTPSSEASFPGFSLRKWLQKIVKMPGNHSVRPAKSCAFETQIAFLCCLSFISRFDDFIIWYTFPLPHQMKSGDVSGAPYAAGLMWTHYFSFDIISIQTCQPVQIGLQTVPSRTWDVSSLTNQRPVLWLISQSEARTGEDVSVTTIFHVPSDFLLLCHTQQQST